MAKKRRLKSRDVSTNEGKRRLNTHYRKQHWDDKAGYVEFRDAEDRLHNDSGPAIITKTGYSEHWANGTRCEPTNPLYMRSITPEMLWALHQQHALVLDIPRLMRITGLDSVTLARWFRRPWHHSRMSSRVRKAFEALFGTLPEGIHHAGDEPALDINPERPRCVGCSCHVWRSVAKH
jgi:hypothetical protein